MQTVQACARQLAAAAALLAQRLRAPDRRAAAVQGVAAFLAAVTFQALMPLECLLLVAEGQAAVDDGDSAQLGRQPQPHPHQQQQHLPLLESAGRDLILELAAALGASRALEHAGRLQVLMLAEPGPPSPRPEEAADDDDDPRGLEGFLHAYISAGFPKP